MATRPQQHHPTVKVSSLNGPVISLADSEQLGQIEILRGFADGFASEAPSGGTRTVPKFMVGFGGDLGVAKLRVMHSYRIKFVDKFI